MKDLTYEYLHGTNIYLYQRKDMFRMNTDTALLADFMKIKAGDVVLDVGTNNGALLLAANRNQPKYLYGIDIQEDAITLAKKNIEHHGITNAEMICADFKEANLPYMDVIICNPPYFKTAKNSNVNESEYLKIARHETYLTMEEFAKKASSLLQEKGRCYLVHRANRFVEIASILRENRLMPRNVQFVYDPNKDEAITVLIEAIKDGKDLCHILAPKYIER